MGRWSSSARHLRLILEGFLTRVLEGQTSTTKVIGETSRPWPFNLENSTDSRSNSKHTRIEL